MDEELKNNEVEEEENKSGINADLIRGHINTIILRTLYDRDKYGYEIIEEIESKSHGQYTLKQPTLYSALKRLESQGYINAYWKTDEVSNGGRRKYYTLTDSGREITERNQAEWEYSRTVIDSLISERNFDFSQPAPTAVDFKILKTSTSRVPTAKDDEDDVKEVREVKYSDESGNKNEVLEETAVVEQTTAQPVQEQTQPTQNTEQQPTAQQVQVQEVVQQIMQEVMQQMQSAQQTVQPVQAVAQTQTQLEPTPVQSQAGEVAANDRMSDARRIHENYLRLISEPVTEQSETPTVPDSEYIDTDKLIYNNKPEAERDYKNLINNLFVKTVKQQNRPEQATSPIQQVAVQVRYEDANVKANKDGLTVSSSEYAVSGSRRKKYNRGKTLFKCSLIIGVILLFEFALSLAFKDSLGLNGISIGYPFVILAIAVAQLAIFGILTTTDFGKCTRKPTSHSYLTASVVITVLLILIIFVTSILLNVSFASAGDITAKIIIPCLVILNIPIFATIFYVFSK